MSMNISVRKERREILHLLLKSRMEIMSTYRCKINISTSTYVEVHGNIHLVFYHGERSQVVMDVPKRFGWGCNIRWDFSIFLFFLAIQ